MSNQENKNKRIRWRGIAVGIGIAAVCTFVLCFLFAALIAGGKLAPEHTELLSVISIALGCLAGCLASGRIDQTGKGRGAIKLAASYALLILLSSLIGTHSLFAPGAVRSVLGCGIGLVGALLLMILTGRHTDRRRIYKS